MKNNKFLRPLLKKDALFMLEWLEDHKITENFCFETHDVSFDSVLSFIKESESMNVNAHFAIVNEADEYQGTVSLKNINSKNKSAEYAIALRKKAQGKGYAFKATEEILEFAFEKLNLERIYLNVLSRNQIAINFYEKFGFIYEGEFVDHVFVHGKMQSLKWFRLLKYEWKTLKTVNRSTIDDVKKLSFPELGDERGNLVVIEGLKDIPFEIKRMFYIYGSDSEVIRGQHANKKSEFVLINLNGTSKVKVVDSKGNEKTFSLDRKHIGIYLPAFIWKDMYDFSNDSVLLVLSNNGYDSSEYIRDFDDFMRGDIDG
jgi:RimJ/RimL family protein N-acetyltransferase/dTDP-4-dehydrorhamnose 3,5-epimerase-like enzyme